MLTTQQSSLTEITERFLNGEVGPEALPEPVWGPIGREVYERTYRRDGETWADTVKRNVLGNLAYAPEAEEQGEAVALFDLMYNFKAVPAGRHIWVTGTKASRFNRNCWVSGWSRRLSDHFAFAAARLFEGGGVGSNYSYDLRQVTQPVLNNLNVVFTINSDHPDYQSIKPGSPLEAIPRTMCLSTATASGSSAASAALKSSSISTEILVDQCVL